MLTKSSIVFALLLSSASAEEVQYVMPEIPTEAMKKEALQIGYIMNGFSMVGTGGSIDVSAAFKVYPPPPVAPPDPPAPKRKR
jgi:hypothetical protein